MHRHVEKEFERYQRHIHPQAMPEEYPSKDGFDNNRQLNVIARGILIHPDLVNLWKQIGYYEICNDVNARSTSHSIPTNPALVRPLIR